MLNNTARVHALRSTVSGTAAAACEGAAHALFEAGGKEVLHEAVQTLTRDGMKKGCTNLLQTMAPKVIEKAAEESAKQIATSVAKQGATQLTKTAAKEAAELTVKQATGQILKSAAGAVGAGAAIDGVFASFEAAHGLYTGRMDGREAAGHVAKETATGALATGAGVLVAAGLVALTGPIGVGGMIIVGGGASLAAKLGLKRLLG